MKRYPSIPSVEDAPDGMFESGHLWVLEKIDGALFRFQLRESGLVRFGDRTRVYDDPDAIPAPYEHAVRHVQRRLDRGALRNAVDDVESVVFFGVSTHRHAIEYDWDRLPSFLGFDVYSTGADAFRPPGATQGIFERLGLDPVNAFARELHTRDFDPESYSVPDSAWYDGPAAGVVIRNKRRGRATILNSNAPTNDGTGSDLISPDTSAAELAETYATDHRLRRLTSSLEADGEAATVETLYDRAMAEIVREHHTRLLDGASSVDMSAFRSGVAARVRWFLDGTPG
ncbi:RNA ligase family protein [Natronomonas sp.]|uniref:RNA ligase family protein n=1 Tax=Natronomonas sp. TaxID=2184060 RepID=UPI0039765C9D